MERVRLNIDKREIKKLTELEQWRSLSALAFDWAVIAIAIGISLSFPNPLVYIAAVLIIGGRMHALGVLAHEAAHYRIIKNRKVSDWLCDALIAWPLFLTVGSYRDNHLSHHAHLNTDKDPDWTIKLGKRHFTFPEEMQYILMNLAGYFVLISTFRDLGIYRARINGNKEDLRYKAIKTAYYLAAAGLITYLGIWVEFLLYWAVPYLTVFFMVLHVRSVAEHFADMEYSNVLTGTRTVYPHWWEKLFFAPHNVNYHIDHHLYPTVPFYNLPKLHKLLMEDPTYREQAHITRGFSTGLLRECVKPARTAAA